MSAAPQERRFVMENERVLGPLMLAPAVLYIVLLVGLPLVLAVLYAFSNVTAGDPRINSWSDFVGFDNFRSVWNDGVFTKSLRNTVFFTIASQAIVLVLSNILAQVLVTDFPGKRIFRFLVMLPWTTPIALSVLGWYWIFDSVYSPIDYVFRQIGLLGPDSLWGPQRNMYWLGETVLAQGSVLMIHVWRTLPLATVILLGGLTSIPDDINEAAEIDGAGFFRKLFFIRLPLLLPIMAVAMLFSMIFTFTDLTVSLVLTRGGPVNDTQMISSWAYFKGIQGGNLAQGAAIALFMMPVLIAFAIAMMRLAGRGSRKQNG
jgi:multiple sugar transport system permease protein